MPRKRTTAKKTPSKGGMIPIAAALPFIAPAVGYLLKEGIKKIIPPGKGSGVGGVMPPGTRGRGVRRRKRS
jgi:hypothetical protein